MPSTIRKTVEKAGRRYSVDGGGVTSLKRKFQVIMSDVIPAAGEIISFGSSVPKIGDPHPLFPYLFATGYEVEEGEGADKSVLTVTVNYERSDATENQEEQTTYTCAVESWGWDAGTDTRELVTDIDNQAVVNSAGDPFESVPSVTTYSPTFTKVVKYPSRRNGVMLDYNCKVNQVPISIGGTTFPACTLLCSVMEQRIIGDANWKYRYTINLKAKSCKVNINGTLTEIGWDAAVVDAGMRKIENGRLVMITLPDAEHGRNCTVTSPELLNGQGQPATRDGQGRATPFVLRFKAYERASFPAWFYTESDIREIPVNS